MESGYSISTRGTLLQVLYHETLLGAQHFKASATSELLLL
jgi:hypothetical protein